MSERDLLLRMFRAAVAPAAPPRGRPAPPGRAAAPRGGARPNRRARIQVEPSDNSTMIAA